MLILAASETAELVDAAGETAENVADTAADQLQMFDELFSFFNINNMLNIGVRVLVIVLVLGTCYRIVRMLINRVFKTRAMIGSLSTDAVRQLETTRRMVVSVVFYAMIIIGIMAGLSIFGFDVRALAASAGIAGVALVYICQKIILDWVNGVFILLERRFSVGDFVTLNQYYGQVQSFSIKQTVIRTDFNETISIPNGEISVVINYSQRPVTEMFDVRIHDATRLDEALEVLQRVCASVSEKHADMLASPCKILGVEEIIGTGMVIRLSFESSKNDTNDILRTLRGECVRSLSAVGLQQRAKN